MTNIGYNKGKAIIFEILGTATWATSPFPYTGASAGSKIDCTCTTSSLISASTVYTYPFCARHIVNSKHFISVRQDALTGQ